MDDPCSPDSTSLPPPDVPVAGFKPGPFSCCLWAPAGLQWVTIPFNQLCPEFPTHPHCWDRIIQHTMNDGSSGQSGQRVILVSHLHAAVYRLIWEALQSPGCMALSMCSAVLVASPLGKVVQGPSAVLCRGGHISSCLECIHH